MGILTTEIMYNHIGKISHIVISVPIWEQLLAILPVIM